MPGPYRGPRRSAVFASLKRRPDGLNSENRLADTFACEVALYTRQRLFDVILCYCKFKGAEFAKIAAGEKIVWLLLVTAIC